MRLNVSRLPYWLKIFVSFHAQVLFALLSCKGRTVGVAFGGGCVPGGPLFFGIGILTWLVLGRGSSIARSQTDASLAPLCFVKIALSLSRRGKRQAEQGWGWEYLAVTRCAAPARALRPALTLSNERLVISRNVLQGFPVARYAGSSHVFPRPTTVEWCRVVAPSFVLTG